MVGLSPDALVVSDGSYALRVQFIGANTVAPQSAPTAAGSGGAALELSQVTYANLWDGITLDYDRGGGILRSTYRIEPHANPEAIRLRYNAPFTLNADGSLTTRFERGQMTESAPVAWQESSGTRVSIPVQFSPRILLNRLPLRWVTMTRTNHSY